MKALTVILLLVSITVISFSQDTTSSAPKKHKHSKMMMKEKAHECSDVCTEKKHVYKHGEKGHTCAKECKHM